MITQLDLQEIRQALEKEYAQLARQLAATLTDNEQTKEKNPDRTDLSWDYIARDRQLALLSMEKKTLAQIEEAMQRLETGSYGQCVQCGEWIDPERLEALPYAALCVYCQQSKIPNRNGLTPQ